MKFKNVISNPPYSASWSADSKFKYDPRFKDFSKLAPKTKADYAFILHDYYELEDDGTAAIILPHGVLFRGQAEGAIRDELIKMNAIDAIIGLPEKLFDVTGIPVLIMVLKKNRKDRNVLFIDAAQEFDKGKNQNYLSPEHIQKILTTYQERKEIDRYSHLATPEEIADNDGNLNIPRYVDTFEPEEPVDVRKLFSEYKKTVDEEKQLKSEIKALMQDLYGTTKEAQEELDVMRELIAYEWCTKN